MLVVGKDRKFPVGGFVSTGYCLSLYSLLSTLSLFLSVFLFHRHTLEGFHRVKGWKKKKIKWHFMPQAGNPLCVLLDWKEPLICVCVEIVRSTLQLFADHD